MNGGKESFAILWSDCEELVGAFTSITNNRIIDISLSSKLTIPG